MKIAMVFDQMLWGGIERVGISYIKLLKDAGHYVDAYVLNPDTASIIDEVKGLCDVKVLEFKTRNCPESRWHIVKYRDMHGLETVVFSMVYMGLTIRNSLVKRKYAIRDVEYDLAIAFSGHINDLTFVSNDYIRAKNKMAWLHGTQYSYNLISPGFFRMYRRIHNLVCLSDQGDQECESYNIKNHIRKRKIYNPCMIGETTIDTQKVDSLKSAYGDYCLMVARLAMDKDHRTAIKAMNYLQKKYGVYKHLVLVGDGERREELEKLIEELELVKWVHFEGARNDVQNYYCSAQMLIHSAPLEGLPTVFLEAMYYGIPIATTDAAPGAREVLGNNEFGLISPIGSAEGLAEKINMLHDNPGLRQEMIRKERERIKDFNPDRIKEQLFDYIEEIMNTSDC